MVIVHIFSFHPQAYSFHVGYNFFHAKVFYFKKYIYLINSPIDLPMFIISTYYYLIFNALCCHVTCQFVQLLS